MSSADNPSPDPPSPDPPSIDPAVQSSPALAGERVSFTGTLASMTHQQAHDLAEQHGGFATQHVSRQTTLLVVGEEGWPLEADGRPSIKLQQVTQWQQEGLPIRIVNESDWLRILGLDDRRREVRTLYTPAMLSQSLGVPLGTIRRWERLGLIRPVRKVYRLPYFDFQEAASVRRLSELLNAGITRPQLEASLAKLRTVLPNIDRPLAQLNLLAEDSRLLIRDARGPVEPITGQRRFEFSPAVPPASNEPDAGRRYAAQLAQPESEDASVETISLKIGTAETDRLAGASRHAWSADQWFAEGCRLLEDQEVAHAIEAFRLALMDRPESAEIHFHLAEALYRAGNQEGALERYHMAVEWDHNYLESWTQMGCLHAARGELESALDAFQIALSVHRDYPDAHWHLADVLVQLGRERDAIVHWRRYLEFDNRGPWAEQARQRLEAIPDAPGESAT
jgi:tetratricopeptide (TPR) repeat protein